ncbi:MAG: tetratricopeptide repeat protein [Candidatus Hinthialibacter antarcticus]|nr:tetratricopeptide repeat protein [Candidatus Hinthialibacter antarcticus]
MGYLQYIQNNPNDANAFKMISLLYHESDQPERAIQAIDKAIQIEPEQVAFFILKGVYCTNSSRYPEAIHALKQACVMDSENIEAYQKLGYAYGQNEQYHEAAACFKRAIKIDPQKSESHSNLGALYMEMSEHALAEDCLMRALTLGPNQATVHANLGKLYLNQRRFFDAEKELRHAITLNPDLRNAKLLLAKVLKEQGAVDDAVQHYQNWLLLEQPRDPYWNNYLLTLQYSGTATSEQLCQAAVHWGRQLSNITPKAPCLQRDWREDRPLRIGYVSGDLRNHPVGYFIEHVFRAHNREQYEVYCYSNAKVEDDLSLRLKRYVQQWRDIHLLNDKAVVQRIQQDGIDILIDLSGHTANNRLEVFAAKPAPVQATWLGYFSSTGLPEMDVIIGDSFVIPPEEEQYYIERVERLPNSYLCFTPPCMNVSVGELPCKKNGFVTFGCFNAISKFNDNVLELWANILQKIEQSRLLLKTNGFDDPSLRQKMIDAFKRNGIDEERIIIEGNSPRIELLNTYNQVDIALDPFPFNGGTTTAEALWMGVPVITLRGDRFVSHVGESILQAIGRPEWIASSIEEYSKIAIHLANQIPSLEQLRASLRTQLCQSPLCDAETFTNDLETLYRRLWHDCIRQTQTGCIPSA